MKIIKIFLAICITSIIIVSAIEFIPDIKYIASRDKLEDEIMMHDKDEVMAFIKEGNQTENSDEKDKNNRYSVSDNEYLDEVPDDHMMSKDVASKYDIKAWIYIDDKVSEPVKQSSDNKDYLNKSYDGSYSKYGTPFIDCRQTIDDKFVIIYGHNVSRGRLFGNLRYFSNKQYCENIQSIMIAKAPDFKFNLYKICNVAIVNEDNNIFANYDIHDEIEKNTVVKLNDMEDKQTILLTTCYGKSGTDKRIIVALQEW